ncbi:hypothetical protein L6452_38370 [Arctium lappa]|uniref:Uncharacterized protein n=1 Tax=Arctium lappa TaxID=4217 RepID=A0ACB8Y713_ARCLA|nr:hypothetical protein L6452_38370 [Arctium lappa]
MKAHEQKHRDKESQVSTASGENSDNLFRSPEKIEKMKLPVSKQAQGKNKITFYFGQHTPSTNSNHAPNNAKEKSSPKKNSVEPLEIEPFQTKGVICTSTTLDVTLIGDNSITKDTKDKFDETQDQKFEAPPHATPDSKNLMHRSGTPHLIGARNLSQVSNDNVETHSRKRISIKDKARKSMGKKHKVEERSETEQCLDKIDVLGTLTKETIASSLPEARSVIRTCLEK